MAFTYIHPKYLCASAVDRAHPTQAPPALACLFPALPPLLPPLRADTPRCLQCQSAQLAVARLLEEALGCGNYAAAAECAATLLPEARSYPRTVACACARLLARGGGGGGGGGAQARDALVRILRLALDSEQHQIWAVKAHRRWGLQANALRRRREALLCGVPPAQAPAVEGAEAAGALEGKMLRACAAARGALAALIFFPGCAPRLQLAVDLAGELLNSQRSRGAFSSDPHIFALRGLACFLLYQSMGAGEGRGGGGGGGGEAGAGEEGAGEAPAQGAAPRAAASAAPGRGKKRARSAPAAAKPSAAAPLGLLSLTAPLRALKAPRLAEACMAPSSSAARARALGEAEAHLRSALRLVLSTLRSVRAGLAARARAGAGGAALSAAALQQRLNTAVAPWVDALAGIPRLLQRVLEACGRAGEGRLVLVDFLCAATCGVGEEGGAGERDEVEAEGEEEEEEEEVVGEAR